MESQEVLVGAPAAATASEWTERFSLFALTAMVVGSMVGAGIFSLPRAFATATGAVRRDHCVDHRRGRHVYAGARVPGARRAQTRSRRRGESDLVDLDRDACSTNRDPPAKETFSGAHEPLGSVFDLDRIPDQREPCNACMMACYRNACMLMHAAIATKDAVQALAAGQIGAAAAPIFRRSVAQSLWALIEEAPKMRRLARPRRRTAPDVQSLPEGHLANERTEA